MLNSLNPDEVHRLISMTTEELFDIRAVTMGINVLDCVDSNCSELTAKVERKIRRYAGDLVAACARVKEKYGVNIANTRIAISPVSLIVSQSSEESLIGFAKRLDQLLHEINIDLLGGFTAFVQKGYTKGDSILLQALPALLAQTERICASVNVASSKAGINMTAVIRMAEIIKRTAKLTEGREGLGAAKLVTFANMPDDNPFMAGACLGVGEPECVINVGVSGPGVVKHALENRLKAEEGDGKLLDLGEIAEVVKQNAARVTRVGELIGRAVVAELQALRVPVEFGIVDLSLAPKPARQDESGERHPGDSVGAILKVMGIDHIGEPGSIAALALLTDAVKKGGVFAASYAGGLSGAFIPVCEDDVLAEAVGAKRLSLSTLEAMIGVCSVGVDMVAIPGDTSVETIAGILADVVAIGVINQKTTAARIIPVPNKKVGDMAHFGGLYGGGPILAVQEVGAQHKFVRRMGRVPAPLVSFNN